MADPLKIVLFILGVHMAWITAYTSILLYKNKIHKQVTHFQLASFALGRIGRLFIAGTVILWAVTDKVPTVVVLISIPLVILSSTLFLLGRIFQKSGAQDHSSD